MDIIIYNEHNKLFEYTGYRPDFIPSDTPYQPGSVVTTTDVDVCHSISFYTIVTGIVNSLNYFQFYNDSDKRKNGIQYIVGMIVSVLTVKVDLMNTQSLSDWFAAKAQTENTFQPYMNLLGSIYQAFSNPLLSKDDSNINSTYTKTYIAVKASEIVRLLNSERSNLRIGCSRWNRSVLSAYDPISAPFEVERDSFVLKNERDSIRITNLLSFTIGGVDKEDSTPIPGAVDALFLYTYINPSTGEKQICSSNLPYNEWVSARNVAACIQNIIYSNYITNSDYYMPTYVGEYNYSVSTAANEAVCYNGIDVSVHNGNINFEEVKNAGIHFVMIREGYGSDGIYKGQVDSLFESNYAAAKRVGLNVGAYHYLYATTVSGAAEEAKGFISNLKNKQFEMPIALDIEDKCQINLSKTTVGDMVTAFMNACENAGYYCVLYSYESFLTSNIPENVLQKYDIWCANTSSSPKIKCGMHQHSFQGRVNGINRNVDLDYAFKDYPALIKSKHFNGY